MCLCTGVEVRYILNKQLLKGVSPSDFYEPAVLGHLSLIMCHVIVTVILVSSSFTLRLFFVILNLAFSPLSVCLYVYLCVSFIPADHDHTLLALFFQQLDLYTC